MPTIPDDERARCPCGSGRAYRRCCLTLHRGRAEGAAAVAAASREIDEVLGELLPLVESRGEYRLACRDGCSACCTPPIRVTWVEAQVIAGFLASDERRPLREAFEASVASWRAEMAEPLAVLEPLLARHGETPRVRPDLDRYEAASLAYHRRGRPCPFNDARGSCAIYPVRPLPCRVTWVVDSSEFCAADRGGNPRVIKHPALQGAADEAHRRYVAIGARSGKPAEKLLSSFVAEALADLRRHP